MRPSTLNFVINIYVINLCSSHCGLSFAQPSTKFKSVSRWKMKQNMLGRPRHRPEADAPALSSRKHKVLGDFNILFLVVWWAQILLPPHKTADERFNSYRTELRAGASA